MPLEKHIIYGQSAVPPFPFHWIDLHFNNEDFALTTNKAVTVRNMDSGEDYPLYINEVVKMDNAQDERMRIIYTGIAASQCEIRIVRNRHVRT